MCLYVASEFVVFFYLLSFPVAFAKALLENVEPDS